MGRHWRHPQAPSTHPVVDWLIAFAAMCFIACAVLLFFGIYSQTKAHDWYPPHCCSGHDCRPIGEDVVTVTDDGFFVKESNETIPFIDPRIRKTPPEGGSKYHRCSQGGRPDGKTICLYIPNWGS